jgi:sugar lactone lactonase YvrE
MKRWSGVVAIALVALATATVHPERALAQAPTFLGSWPTTGIPLGLCLDASGLLYIPDEYNDVTMRVFTQAGAPVATFPGTAIESYGVVVRSDQTIMVSDYYGCRVLRYSASGTLLSQFSTGGQRAHELALDASENVFVTDDPGDAVRRFTPQGALLAQWTVTHPSGVAVVDGLVYVAEMFGGNMRIFTLNGTPQGSWPTGCTHAEQLSRDAAGHLYLADFGQHRLKCFATNGTLLWSMGPSVPGYPYPESYFFSVVVAPDGTLYAGDFQNRNVLMFSPLPVSTIRDTMGGLKSRYRGGHSSSKSH